MSGPRKPWTQVKRENELWARFIVGIFVIWLVVTAITKAIVLALEVAVFAGAAILATLVLRGLWRFIKRLTS